MKSNPISAAKSSAAQPSTTKPKEFKWMGFKSHMMATMAKWRESDYLTDTTFQCYDGQVSAHRLILAAASPLLKEAMSQDLCDQVVISIPEVTSGVMTAILELVYKGRMNITPTNTWAIRSLVETLRINAEDVSVISAASAAKKTAPSLTEKSPIVIQADNLEAAQPLNNGAEPRRAGRKRKETTEVSTSKIPVKVTRVSTPGTTPKAENKQNEKKSSIKQSKKVKNPSKSGKKVAPTAAEIDDPLNTSTGFHDLEDVETWVCAVCQCYDPIITTPVKNNKQAEAMMTTEWIGCDCNRWYHQYCTKLKHIDDSFSCKQVGLECLPLS